MPQALTEILGDDGPLARALPDFRARASSSQLASACGAGPGRARLAGGGGGHRHRQDLRLPGAGAACPASACSSPPARARCRTSCSTRTCRCWRGARDAAHVALLKGRSNYLCRYRWNAAWAELPLQAASGGLARGALAAGRRPRTGRPGRGAALPDAHPLWPQSPPPATTAPAPVAPNSAAATWSPRATRQRSRHRHRESPSAARGPGAQGRRLRRHPAERRRRDHRRGAPDPGSRHAVLRRRFASRAGRAAAADCRACCCSPDSRPQLLAPEARRAKPCGRDRRKSRA